MKHLRCEDDNLDLYRPVIYLASMEANFRWTTTPVLRLLARALRPCYLGHTGPALAARARPRRWP